MGFHSCIGDARQIQLWSPRWGRGLSEASNSLAPALQISVQQKQTASTRPLAHLPGAAGVMAKSPLSMRPKTPMELPGDDRGGDPSPRPGERERESSLHATSELSTQVQCML